MRLEAVCVLLPGVAPGELADWVALGWVRPETRDGEYLFAEIDIARARLILDLRRSMAVAEDTMPLVLSLLDQVYALRGRLSALTAAVASQPEPVRAAVLAALDDIQPAPKG